MRTAKTRTSSASAIDAQALVGAAPESLNDAYVRATAMAFAGIVACQIGTAIASRTERATLRSVGLFTNPFLLWGILFEVVFAAAVVYLPPLQPIFHTAPLARSSSRPSRRSR